MSSCFGYCIPSKSRAALNAARLENSELLVLGLEGAGKSLLMRQICNVANRVQKAIPLTQPTVGVELYKVNLRSKYSSQVTHAREIGGCMRPVWPQYFANANLFLYVISINATGLLATAVVELHSLLLHPHVQGKPVCVVLHEQKCDSPPVSPAILAHVLDVDGLSAAHTGVLTVLNVSANPGAELQHLSCWIRQNSLLDREG
ncbi:hypothetical protein WJX77_009874 [Trebouxia sp. C0004]